MSRKPTHEVWNGPVKVGAGFKDFCNAVARRLDHEQNTREEREREAAAQHAYAAPDEYYLLVRRVRGGIEVESIEEFPMGIGRLKAQGRNYDHAVTEIRFAYACALANKGLLPDLQEARTYALRATFRAALEG